MPKARVVEQVRKVSRNQQFLRGALGRADIDDGRGNPLGEGREIGNPREDDCIRISAGLRVGGGLLAVARPAGRPRWRLRGAVELPYSCLPARGAMGVEKNRVDRVRAKIRAEEVWHLVIVDVDNLQKLERLWDGHAGRRLTQGPQSWLQIDADFFGNRVGEEEVR